MTAAVGVADARVPGYLGRVLDGGGVPVGTCFQVAPGVLVTAWHVLDDIGAAADDACVRIDPLAGGEAFDAAVARMDSLRDLAVLTCAADLPAVAGPLWATDQVPLRVQVTVTGHAVPDDPGHMYRFLDAPGEWAGGTTRDEVVPLGRMTSSAVVPGMSGGPVICDGDGAVAGVVSGRYNSADGWLAGTVWVARTEDLAVLLDGIAEVAVEHRPQAGPVAGRPLAEVTDPFELEVHRPVQPEDAPPGLPVLPPYVPREHDQVLGQVVRAAADGRSGIAVLVGGSSTGKTRACWEALALLRDQDPPWRLWHPIDPSRPDAALARAAGHRAADRGVAERGPVLPRPGRGRAGRAGRRRAAGAAARPGPGPGAGAGHRVARVLGHPDRPPGRRCPTGTPRRGSCWPGTTSPCPPRSPRRR